MVDYDKEDDEEQAKPVFKRVYLIINGEKHYIDPDVVKKYNLEDVEISFFSGRKIYIEEV